MMVAAQGLPDLSKGEAVDFESLGGKAPQGKSREQNPRTTKSMGLRSRKKSWWRKAWVVGVAFLLRSKLGGKRLVGKAPKRGKPKRAKGLGEKTPAGPSPGVEAPAGVGNLKVQISGLASPLG
jgi:hypothetical protein